MSSFPGRGAPVFEMREHFAMTDLLVRDSEQATRLAEAIAGSDARECELATEANRQVMAHPRELWKTKLAGLSRARRDLVGLHSGAVVEDLRCDHQLVGTCSCHESVQRLAHGAWRAHGAA